MKKILALFVCLCLPRIAVANCHSCCTTPTDIQFCISSDGVNCTGGCDCCPSESQIGQNSDGTYFCCKGDTPQVTAIEGKTGYQMCCKEGSTAYSNDGVNGYCCQGTATKGQICKENSNNGYCDNNQKVVEYKCCSSGSWVPYRSYDDAQWGYTLYACGGQDYCDKEEGGSWMALTYQYSSAAQNAETYYGCGRCLSGYLTKFTDENGSYRYLCCPTSGETYEPNCSSPDTKYN